MTNIQKLQKSMEVGRIRTQMDDLIYQMWTNLSRGDEARVTDAYEKYQIARLILVEDYEVDEDNLFSDDERVTNLPWEACGMKIPVIR